MMYFSLLHNREFSTKSDKTGCIIMKQLKIMPVHVMLIGTRRVPAMKYPDFIQQDVCNETP
jgi:hypothetical protein